MSDPDPRVNAGNLRKRRGVSKASITRINSILAALEADTTGFNKASQSKQLLIKLNEAASAYERCHLALIDTIEDEDVLQTEQETLDEQMDIVQSLAVRLQTLIDVANASSTPNERKTTSKRINRLDHHLSALSTSIAKVGDPDIPHLKQFEEQLLDYKTGLTDVNNRIFSLDLEDTDELVAQHTRLEGVMCALSLRLKKLMVFIPPTHVSARIDGKGAKLPTLDVPTFDGNLLSWRSFWEQFTISIHECTNLSQSEKLVYLQQAIKGGSSKDSIEDLSRTGENYEAAVKCLRERFDHPRLIHQAHVRSILDSPPLNGVMGKEIRKLHDHVLQHLRALKAMSHDPSGPFITSALELKLDQTTMFEWHGHSHDLEGIPHYSKLLSFFDSQAQATESTFVDSNNKKWKRENSARRNPNSTVASHVTAANGQSSQLSCVKLLDTHCMPVLNLNQCPMSK